MIILLQEFVVLLAMFDSLTTIFGALGFAGHVRYPTLLACVFSFVLGAVTADLIVFVMLGSIR